ncbi:hypothetical protein [uncultured Agrobacterium sp.]|uniref:hypothetical protein n=1 Tax=uncultured Agrobacterium sp. TaxID=157277 RepID=UPI0025FB6857|nr:hypothetical protein [uncultured Agrobacterium sp.]
MTNAMLNIRVIQPRMLSPKMAAEYVGIPQKRFPGACPVTPVAMPGDVKLYDVRDLDKWLDELKGGTDAADDDIIGKLGGTR